MNPFLLYLFLVKATLTSFSGATSLPVIQRDLVETHHVLTLRQLNAAMAAGRATPGPMGLYVVSVGYFVAGPAGAVAGWLAMITPAFFIIPMLHYLGKRAEQPAVKSAIQTVIMAAAGLIAAALVPLAKDALASPMLIAIAVSSFAVLVFTRRDPIWVIAGSALVALAIALI